MVKPENTLPTRERAFPASKRKQLVEDLTANIRNSCGELVYTTQWQSLEPYMCMVGMVGILQSDEALDYAGQSHLRKMIAVEADVFSDNMPAPGLSEFKQVVHGEAGAEIAEFQGFIDRQVLPKPWANAVADATSLRLKLTPDGTKHNPTL